jgi:hypothetical protein
MFVSRLNAEKDFNLGKYDLSQVWVNTGIRETRLASRFRLIPLLVIGSPLIYTFSLSLQQTNSSKTLHSKLSKRLRLATYFREYILPLVL